MPSNGSFYFGQYGFLYKKQTGVGARRSSAYATNYNHPEYLYNKYQVGGSGVGAQTTANRRAKNRLATVCTNGGCFPQQPFIGHYPNRWLPPAAQPF